MEAKIVKSNKVMLSREEFEAVRGNMENIADRLLSIGLIVIVIALMWLKTRL